VAGVAALKEAVDGDIVVYASARLVRTLLAHGLADELRLTVFPVVLGAGERLFADADAETLLRLVEMRTLGEGLAFLRYAILR
jgi:dihydrofolate reductase